MDFNAEDLQPGPVGGNLKAGPKFQPKAKPRPRKDKVLASPPCDGKEKPVTTSTIAQDVLHSVSPIETSIFTPGLPQIDGDEKFASMEISPQAFMAENVDSRDILHSGITNCDVQVSTQGQTSAQKSGKEPADIFSELESLDDILSDHTTVNALSAKRKFQPKAKVNSQPRKKLPTSCPVTTDAEGSISKAEVSILHVSNEKDLDEGPTLPAFSSVGDSTFKPCGFAVTETSQEVLVSQETVNIGEIGASDYDRDFLIDDRRSEREEAETFPGLGSLGDICQATTTAGDAQFIHSETEYLVEGLTPVSLSDDFLDFSTTRLSDSAPADPPYKLPVMEESTIYADASGSNAAMPVQGTEPQDVSTIPGKERTESRKKKNTEDKARKVHFGNVEELSQGPLDDRPALFSDEGTGAGKSLRQMRKRSAASILEHGMEDRTTENGDQLAESSKYSLVDEDDNNDNDDEYRDEISHRKRAPSKAKKDAQNEKKVRKRKNSSDGTATSSKEPSKKKFSHTTRRNKRQVNKVLLETPEEEINPRQIMLKDLILLAEVKERTMNKNAAVLKKTIPNQSVNNSFAQDTPYRNDDPFSSMQDLNPDDDAATVQPNPPIHNYHSYMDKIPRERWSKQDTELFYQAIRQFGTDFAMIQQLFPGRTRHQVKLKYKKEERQYPSRVSDALTNRSKDHSHFELVIEKLRQATADAENGSDRDMETAGVSGEAVAPEINEEEASSKWKDEQAAKSEGKEEEGKDDIEPAEVPQDYDLVKNTHKEENDYKWNEYESDYEEYVPF